MARQPTVSFFVWTERRPSIIAATALANALHLGPRLTIRTIDLDGIRINAFCQEIFSPLKTAR